MNFKWTTILALLLFVCAVNIEAQRRSGSGGGAARQGGGNVNRSAANTSVRSDQTVNRNVDRNRDVNRDVSRDVERDIDRDIDIDNDIDIDGYGYDRWGHPVARGVTAAVAIGTTVALLTPDCSTVVVGGIGYSQCGSTWYQPNYGGTTVQYTAVAPPPGY